jgi:uncharacterized protein (TIGR02300 family)
MSDKAAPKLERGIKRTCQDPDCGERFYDLNRDPITCPICNSVHAIALQPPPQAIARPAPRSFKPPTRISNEPKEEVPTVEDGEELAALEGEEEPAPAEEDDTFIEEVDFECGLAHLPQPSGYWLGCPPPLAMPGTSSHDLAPNSSGVASYPRC